VSDAPVVLVIVAVYVPGTFVTVVSIVNVARPSAA